MKLSIAKFYSAKHSCNVLRQSNTGKNPCTAFYASVCRSVILCLQISVEKTIGSDASGPSENVRHGTRGGMGRLTKHHG